MKKFVRFGVALTVLSALSACTVFDPDLDSAAEKRAENRAQIRSEIGCQFADDHAAYRRCLLSTYESSKPKTFATSQDASGQPVAIVSSGASNTVVTPRSSATETPATVAEPTPVAAPQPQVIVPQEQPAGQGTLTAISCGDATAPCFYQTTDLYEMNLPAPVPAPVPAPAPAPVYEQQYVVEQPKYVTVEQTETVVEKPLEVVPMPQPLPDKTWWETYQEEQQPAPLPTVVCPCPDPNDPCPQCVVK